MVKERGWLYHWKCTCGCGSGTWTLFADERQQSDIEYCKLHMYSHIKELIKDVNGQKDGKHIITLLKVTKAVVKIVEEDWV